MVNYSDIRLIFFSLLQRAKQNYNEIGRIIPDSFGTCKLSVVAGCGTGYDLKKNLISFIQREEFYLANTPYIHWSRNYTRCDCFCIRTERK
jgi:hypothetical protein